MCDQFRYCYWVIVHNRSTHWRQHCIHIAFSYNMKQLKTSLNKSLGPNGLAFLSHSFFNCYSFDYITMQPKAKDLKDEQWTKWKKRASNRKEWAREKKKRSNFFHFIVNQLIFLLFVTRCVSTHLWIVVESLLYCNVPSFKNYSINNQLSTAHRPLDILVIVRNVDYRYWNGLFFIFHIIFMSFFFLFFFFSSSFDRCCYFYKQKRKYNQKKKKLKI